MTGGIGSGEHRDLLFKEIARCECKERGYSFEGLVDAQYLVVVEMLPK